jgi:hypothetical protein
MKIRIIIGIICLFIIATFGSCITHIATGFIEASARCIRGEILDFETKKPLSDIEITTPKGDKTTYSDSVGFFHIHLDLNNDYSLLFNNTTNNGYSQKDTMILDSLYQEEKIIIYLTKQQ